MAPLSAKILYPKIKHWLSVNRRAVAVIAILLLPILVVSLITHSSLYNPKERFEEGPNKDFPFLSRNEMITSTEEIVQKAETLTPEQYEHLRTINPHFPKTLEEYQRQMKARLTQLRKMTEEELGRELQKTLPPLQHSNSVSSEEQIQAHPVKGYQPPSLGRDE